MVAPMLCCQAVCTRKIKELQHRKWAFRWNYDKYMNMLAATLIQIQVEHNKTKSTL